MIPTSVSTAKLNNLWSLGEYLGYFSERGELSEALKEECRGLYYACKYRHGYSFSETDEVSLLGCLVGVYLAKLLDDADLDVDSIAAFIWSCRVSDLTPYNGAYYDVFPSTADIRLTYAAVIVAWHLGFTLEQWADTVEYVDRCFDVYSGAYGSNPLCEPHSAYTHCALEILDKLGAKIGDRQLLYNWTKQVETDENLFFGRVGKRPDSCYTFYNLVIRKTIDATYQITPECMASYIEAYLLPDQGFIGDIDRKEADLKHTYIAARLQNIYDNKCKNYLYFEL